MSIMQLSEATTTENAEQPPRDYEITISDCNSISKAQISLRGSALNIKYGPNGIGKSTIASALVLRAQGDNALEELVPFKYREGSGHPKPTVVGADEIMNVLVFDDDYVSQFVFQRDEVLKNSFEIFINTDEYKQGVEDIASMFEALKYTISQQPEFEEAVTGFTELRDAFGVTATGAIAKTSRGYKALGIGGKLTNIPESLRGYSEFLHGDDPAGWITWQSKGAAFLDLSSNCPFCSKTNVNKETARKVSEEYESAAVKNMSALRNVIDRLGHYFKPEYLSQLNDLTMLIAELSPEQGQFLANLRGEVQTLLNKLTDLRGLSFHALRDEQNIGEVLGNLKVELALLPSVDSDATREVVGLINQKLDEVASQINNIRARIGVQKTMVARLIRDNQDGINEFLKSAGYRYSVRIEPSEDSYRMILEHEDAPGHLQSASRHLSFGERNAFALVLFMHHVLRESPDLVVLDDPVSSFDKTKKFAILHQLFLGPQNIQNHTTVLFTHDIEPAIDMAGSGTSDLFIAAQPVVHFLSSKSGVVAEKLVEKDDIRTFSQVCDVNIASSSDDVIKCIYLRRKYELHGERGVVYDTLSSLLHLRDAPDRRGAGGERERLSASEVAAATEEIGTMIPGFDYAVMIQELRNPAALKARFEATDVGYEKIQIFRIMSELNPKGLRGDSAFRKFINECFHIENEYVMQLNPRHFDAVPEYVIEACTALLDKVAVA